MNYKADGADDLDPVFTALASRHRRQIVHLLALQPASIQQLARRLGISLTAIHRHINVLEDAALIRRKKVGRVNFLAINRATMLRVQEWAQQYHAYWGSDEETLENYVEAIERAERPTTDPEEKE
ncbi:MAG TPA: winged helix-turn-helix domain-containing protein [Propionibacteriaceae bacterium]|nr:winged helix-turn-helix domain-containing protein [Propionibacteriaceae bacterium]